jgi:MFS family permease
MSLDRSPALRYFADLRLLGPTVGLYLLTIALVGFVVDGGVFAVLLNLYLLRLGFGPEPIGVVNAAGTLAFALASLPAGALGERFGSRQMMLLGIALTLVGCLLLPLADMIPVGGRLVWLVSTFGLLYLGLAIFFVNTAPFVMGRVAAAQRTQVFSIQTALLSFSAFLGSLVGGALPALFATLLGTDDSRPEPYRYALLVAGLALLPAIFALRGAGRGRKIADAQEETRVAPAGAEVLAPILGVLGLIALVRLLQVAGVAATMTYFNVYLDAALSMPTAQIGMIIAVGRLLAVPVALAAPPLTSRFGNRAVVIGATLGSALSILPLALIPHWGAAGLSFIGLAGLSWIRYAASLVYFLELVPPSRRATVSGVTEMAGGICFTLITFGGGYVIALLGYRTLFLWAAAITAASALVFWLAFRGRAPYAERGGG